jgi:hypothetical protein
VNPLRNPYVPGAGRQPPELAGRDGELTQVEVELHRGADGLSVRGFVLVGLRGVGKTVLLNAMRSRAHDAGWATAKIEARLGQSLREPLATALATAVRGISRRARNRERVQAVLSALAALHLSAGPGGVTVSVDTQRRRRELEVDLTGLFTDLGDLARDAGAGVAVFIDEMQDIERGELAALCGACHEMSQTGHPVLLVGAGLPNLPVVLSAARSYSERLFTYLPIDRLDPEAAGQALIAPAARRDVTYTPEALAALAALADGYPYFIQAYGKATWDAADTSPITADDVAAARSDADRALALGFFGARYERATAAEREYMHAMARHGDHPVSTGAVARTAQRPLRSLSNARDALIRKGLVYSPERGYVAFTVPHFAAYLRDHDEPGDAPGRRHAHAQGSRS